MRPDFLYDVVEAGRILENEPMSEHTSFRVGGPADIYVEAASESELLSIIERLRERDVPFLVIGQGSNLLVSDQGYRGAIVRCRMERAWVEAGRLHAQAGTSLKALYETALDAGLVGLEFASGIPGSLGGAITMNAGAYGGELKDVVETVRVLDAKGCARGIPADEMGFGYRTSNVEKEGLTVLGAILQLHKGDTDASRMRAGELAAARRAKQPLTLPSAGSTFRRPPGNFAGTLIQSCGLKGASVGGAQVSAKHAGFIVNAGGATAADIWALIREVQSTVQVMTGIRLEPEVRFVGTFDA